MNLTTFKTAYRSLIFRKGFTLLNVLGITIGMICCLLIFHYVSFEKSYDSFSPVAEQVVRLRLDSYNKGSLSWRSATSYPAIGPTMKKDFPEVLDYCRLIDFESVLSYREADVKFKESKGYYADPGAIPMLGIQMVQGDASRLLLETNQIILSQSTAKKYFGLADPIGKRLSILESNDLPNKDLSVVGIYKDFPVNSHLILNYLVSYKTLQSELNAQGDTSNATETGWGWYDFYTYLQLKPGTDLKKFESKFPAFCDRYMNNSEYAKKNNVTDALTLIPLKDIHLQSNVNQEAEVNGNGKAVSFLFLIALFILGIAWVNYVNLSTARSVERAKEVGVRKVLGAHRYSLLSQFLTESFILNLIGLALSVGILIVTIPYFDDFTGKPDLPFFTLSLSYWVIFFIMFTAGTILSGIYPALVLSGFQPVKVLKGAFKNTDSGILLRKGLMVTQFVTSIALIAGTIIVRNQVKYMSTSDLGADIEQTLVIEGSRTMEDSIYSDVFQPFKQRLLSQNQVSGVAASTSVMGKEIYWTNSIRRGDLPDATAHTMYHMGVDYDFMPNYGIKMIAGRSFSKEFATDNRSVVLTDVGARELGFSDMEAAVNKKIIRGRDTLTILGIAESYHHQGLQKSLDPMIILLRPNARTFYSVKLKTNNPANAISSINAEWSTFFPSDPFNYFFLDESYNSQYKGDILFGKVFGIFALLGIIIACFGLLGLSAYNVQQRTKEIGVRKVIGASTSNIFILLSKDFMKLVLLSLFIAIPICWYIMRSWLQGFAFRTSINWAIFLVAGTIAVGIAFLTIQFHVMKAIRANPIKSLRTE